MSSIKTSKIVPLSSALTIDSTTTAVVGKLCAGGTAGDIPLAPLQVYGASSSQGAANRGVFLASNATNSRQVQIGINDSSQLGWIAGWAGAGGLTFCINPTGANVGIGTTTPAVALDINGEARSSTSTTSASNDKTLTTKDYVDANDIGAGQTWQDVKSSRAVNTVYTNNTGKPIMVCVTCGSSQRLDPILVNSVTVGDIVSISTTTIPFSFIVPNGSTYKCGGSGDSFSFWVELR